MTRTITKPKQATVRVAIYTRKSTDEGLDQEFNSLDAQRQAVEAYIASQRGEGWAGLPEHYDDGGFTGANMKRPAFERMIADIKAGRVDVVAAYKLDRLSRSIADFVGLMRLFEEYGVTFVSITQQFSTATSVGRMTMHLLATFAQFERDTISERTRDKVRAARRRGMWTGGRPVLGYDVRNKKLIVNADEAEQVRAIFVLYLELGSLMATIEELNRRGWRTKTFTTGDGKLVHGGRYDKSSLHRLLTSTLYIGRIGLGDESFEAAHEAIVDRELWDNTQATMKRHGRRGGADTPNKYGLLLRGIIHCGVCGSTMTHAFSTRAGRRWTYYACSKSSKQGAAACPRSRVSVAEIEAFVVEKVREIGRDSTVVTETIAAVRREREARLPEVQADVRRHDAEKKRLIDERTNLVNAVAMGGSAAGVLMQRVADIDDAVTEADERATEARQRLVEIQGEVIDESELRAALASFDPVWEELFPRERARILALLIERVTFVRATGEVAITFRPSGVKSLGRRSA
jgi:site-specific DNA recombinase